MKSVDMIASMKSIQSIRDRLDMSQKELADALGLKQTAISAYERGKAEIPRAKAQMLIDLAYGRQLLIDFNHIYGNAELPAGLSRAPKPAPALPREPEAGTKVPRRPGRPVVYSGS